MPNRRLLYVSFSTSSFGLKIKLLLVPSQLEHSANRLLNLELMEKRNPAVWLHFNAAAEGITKCINLKTSGVKRKTDELNITRRVNQEKEYTKIAKLMNKRHEAILTAWQIKSQLTTGQ